MNQLKAHSLRLSLVFAVGLFASAVCVAQTPATTTSNSQSTTEKASPSAAATPDKHKSSVTTTSSLDEELAKTPTGKTVAKFFAAFNSGDLKQMRAFHESTGGDVGNADKDLEMFERTGGLKLHSLTQASKEKINILAQTKKDAAWLNFMFTIGAEEPYPIDSISVRPATAPAN